jgi:hypothetical protein
MKPQVSEMATLKLAVTLLVAAIGCAGADDNRSSQAGPFTEPVIAVRVDGASGGFSFVTCSRLDSQPALIRRLRVSREDGELQCAWRQGMGAPLPGQWLYASAPSGSALAGSCGALDPTQVYRIEVDGPGRGFMTFRGSDARVVERLGGSCSNTPP